MPVGMRDSAVCPARTVPDTVHSAAPGNDITGAVMMDEEKT